MQSVVTVNGLVKQFGNFTAVNNLSFTVPKNSVYGFLGQNGAGKSTTMRMLLTLIKPTSGTITMMDKNLLQHKNEVLQQVGALIEKPDVYKYLSAYENLKLFTKLSGVNLTKAQALQQLAIVGLQPRAFDKVKTFSQGMKQRLGIAIAMAHNPQLIILDEPTNGLDPQGIADIRNLIISLKEEHNKTIIVSSHLLSEIQQVASHILIIDKGKKIVEGKAQDIVNPNQLLVKIKLSNVQQALQLMANTQWQQYIQRTVDNELFIQIATTDLPHLSRYITQLPVDVLAITPVSSLEDYFLQATQQA